MKITSHLLLWAGFNLRQNLSCPYINEQRTSSQKKKSNLLVLDDFSSWHSCSITFDTGHLKNPGAGFITQTVIAQEIESIWLYVSYLVLFLFNTLIDFTTQNNNYTFHYKLIRCPCLNVIHLKKLQLQLKLKSLTSDLITGNIVRYYKCRTIGWLVVLRLNVPVNNFSVMSGRSHRFLGN